MRDRPSFNQLIKLRFRHSEFALQDFQSMRTQARRAGLPDYVNLWAGQAYPLTMTVPAGDLVRDLWAEAGAVLARVSRPRSG